MANKSIWESKTFWAGAIEITIGALLLLSELLDKGDLSSPAGWALFGVGVLKIALRVVTTGPVSVKIWLLCLSLAMPASADAQTSDPGYASYRIWCGNGAGSCTGIAPELVVTNVHVAGTGGASCRIAHPLTGREWRGHTVAGDRDADVALVLISSADLDWVELGDDPATGKQCFHYGYGGGTTLKMGTGQYMRSLGRSWEAFTSSVSGDSGGGLFDEYGRLCSVNWGSTDTSGGISISTPVSYVSRLLAQYRGNPREPRQQPRQPIGRGGRPPPKQPIQLGPKRLVDPLREFDAEKFLSVLATKWPVKKK